MKSKILVPEARWNENRAYWQINVQQDHVRRSFYSSRPGRAGKREAESKAAEWLVTHKAEDMRFDIAWAQFLESRKKALSQSSYDTLKSKSRTWIEPSGLWLRKLSRLTIQDWQDILDSAYQQGRSRRTCGNIRDMMEAFSDYAQKNRWPMDPLPGQLTINDHAPKYAKKIVQPDQLKVLFSDDRYGKALKPCWYINAFRLAVVIGLRRGEVCGLQWSDVDGSVLRVNRAINALCIETRGKNDNALREIVLPENAAQVLRNQAALLKAHGVISPWVFPTLRGERSDPKAIYHQWQVYRETHGIEASFHGLRHTMISIYKADVPEQLLKEVVGHSVSMDTFGVYGKEVDGEAERAASLMDTVLDRLMK